MTGVDESYRTLLTDNRSGSSEILKQTAEWVRQCIQENRNPSEIHQVLMNICRAHPAMALLQNFAASFSNKEAQSVDAVDLWMRNYQEHETRACHDFSRLLTGYSNVLVHSYSHLLYESLRMSPKKLNIFCTESRPAMEGRVLAEKLATTHHRIQLVTDMAAFDLISQVEILAFGCDSVTPRGIVNKIGTAPLAEIAQLRGRMNYFVATTEKVLRVWDDQFLMRQGPPEEIYTGTADVKIENRYFDLTPADYVSGLVMETGISRTFEYA